MEIERQTVRTLFRNLCLVVILGKAFGILPWRMNDGKLTKDDTYVGRIHSLSWFTYYILNLCWACYVAFIRIYGIEYYTTVYPPIRFLRMAMYTYQKYISANGDIGIIEGLSRYDRKVKLLGCDRKDKFLILWIICIPLMSLISLTMIGLFPSSLAPKAVWPFKEYRIQWWIVFWNLQIVADHLVTLKFCIVINLFYQRYQHLNTCVVPSITTFSTEDKSGRPAVTLIDISQLHSILTIAIRTAATAYSTQICITVIFAVDELNAMRLDRIKHSEQSIVNFGNRVFYIGILFWFCHNTGLEANKLGISLLKIKPGIQRNSNFVDSSIDLALYLYNHRVSITAANFFQVDFPTLLSLSSIALNLTLLFVDFKKEEIT